MKPIKSLILLLFFGIILLQHIVGQNELKIYEQDISIPTYLVDEPDKVPHFYTGRAYQGAQGRVYPYPFDDRLTDQKENVAYKGLFLENEYLEICVLPELGGRLYYMIDKSNGYNVIYRNNVVKPAMIGMLGAWISGGVEWNVPHHHRASTFMPTDYELVENADGSKTIWVGELEIRHQVRWMVGMTLFPDNARLKVDIRYLNQTSQAKQFLIWANTAVHTNENYQVIYPPQTEFATYHRKIDFTRWPISNELYRGSQFEDTDISLWKNTPAGGSFFAWEDQGQFVAGIDHGVEAGICVVGNPNIVIGKKLWTWGNSPRADMWEQILTDEDGPYIEIMTGAYSNNQPDYSWCHPYFTKEATMYFMPLRGMSSVKESNLDLAVNFEMQEDEGALVELHAYRELKNLTISLKKGDETLWKTQSDTDPATPQKWNPTLSADTDYYDLTLLVVDAKGHELIRYQPQQKPGSPMPEPVEPAPEPKTIKTVEEVVFTGLRLEQIFNPRVSPVPYYEEALEREPNNAFANLRMGAWCLKEGMFEQAEQHLQLATDKWTTDYTRAKNGEPQYLLALSQVALGKEQAAADNLHRASWDYAWYGASHLQLALQESRKGRYARALEHINQSLSVDVNNIRAQEIRLSLLRKLGKKSAWTEQLTGLKTSDPLNLYLQGELLLADQAKASDFATIMRNELQNYLDLAVKLGNAGLYDDSHQILVAAAAHPQALVSQNALVYYLQGYYFLEAGNPKASEAAFQQASKQSLDYCFPFRYETANALEAAISYNPKDYKAWYLYGNLLYDRQPALAVEKWERAVEIQDDLAMAHRNLAFAADHLRNDPTKASKHIARAIQISPDLASFYQEQDDYAIKTGETPETRLQYLTHAGSTIDMHNNSLARKVEMLILTGEEEAALGLLEESHFRKVEGVGNIHNSWVDAWLISGKKKLTSGNNREAIRQFEKTLEYPRNLEIGKNSREGQSHFFIGLASLKSGKKKQASSHFRQAVSCTFQSQDLYYKGLSYIQLGEQESGEAIFKEMIQNGEERVNRINEQDFFSIFGNTSSDNVRLSNAYALQGMGYWGLGEKSKAESLFQQALAENPSQFAARTRLFDLPR